MAQKKRKKSTTTKKTYQTAQQKRKKHIASIVLFAVALFTFFLFIIEGESFWTTLHTVWRGLFGNLFGLPVTVALGYVAIICAKDAENRVIRNKSLLLSLGLVVLSATVDVFCIDETTFSEHIAAVYTDKWWSGGAVGALLGYPLRQLLGQAGACVTLIIASLVYILLSTRTTLLTFLGVIGKPAQKMKEVAVETHERSVARRAERQEQFDIERTTAATNLSVPVVGEEPDLKPKARPEPDLLTREAAEKASKRVVTTYFDKTDLDVPVAEELKKAKRGRSRKEKKADDDWMVEQLNGDVTVISDDAPSAIEPTPEPIKEEYKFPPISLLKRAPRQSTSDIKHELKANAEKLVDTLRSFGVETRVIDISRGPSVTRYELQPAAGVRVSKIANLADDIALNLATAGVRIEAPIPGKPAVGIELPNKVRSSVSFRELIESDIFESAKSKVNCVLGRDITGEITCMDISKMPHILIAGTTGSGKSVCLNSLIMSILYKAKPEEVKMLLIDPKAVELNVYNGIPHLLVPVVSDARKASGALGWAVNEMLQRYKILQEHGVRNIDSYNELAERTEGMQKLSHIVIFIDELADLMMAAPKEVEDYICRLAQMARAAGMHLVIATQRPSVDVITGLIKANIPSRIALTTSSPVDSRTILDAVGAEKLIGKGDMLYNPIGATKPTRVQGCWISDDEIESVVTFLKRRADAEYDQKVIEEIDKQAEAVKGKKGSDSSDSDDDFGEYDAMLPAAMEVVVEAGQASTSLLQRKLKLGYARAARIMDQLEEKGVVGPFEGAKPRRVLMSKQELLEYQATSAD